MLSTKLIDQSLFYPCAGRDWKKPIELFADEVKNFFFVDRDYTSRLSRNRVFYRPIEFRIPRGYRLVGSYDKLWHGKTMRRKNDYEVGVTVYELERLSDGRLINVHLCQSEGYNAFRSIFDDRHYRMSIFFHRGDSPGEGGSGFYWLDWRLKDVLRRLEKDGLIVSDGSNAAPQLSTFCRKADIEEKAVDLVDNFCYKEYDFKCKGYAGERNGPTLIWQVGSPNELCFNERESDWLF